MEHPASTCADQRHVQKRGAWLLSRRCRSASLVIGTAILLLAEDPGVAAAAPLPQGAAFRYTIINERVADAIQDFSRDVGLRVNVNDAVEGRITTRLTVTTVRQFLDTIASNNGVDWYYDGFTLYVTASSEALSRTLPIPAAGFAALQAALSKDGVSDGRFPLRVIPGSNEMHVSGPPRYVNLVVRTAYALTAPDENASEVTSTVVFRGTGSQKINFESDEKP